MAAHAAAAGALKTAAALHLLTFNIAGIPVVHPEVARRMPAIGAAIKTGGYDIVGLQEAWFDGDARVVADAAGLPYIARLRPPLSYTGLAVLSRWPITQSRQIYFTSRPSALRPLLTGEGLARKGALFARVQTPRGPLDVYAAHLISDYPNVRYYTVRLTQAFELAEAVGELSRDMPFVLLMDANASPSDPEYRVLVDLLGLDDACVRDGGDECLGEDEGAQRIDHVLLPASQKTLARAHLVFTDPLPGTNLRYSDHTGVDATVAWGALKLRLDFDKRRRLEALSRVDAAIARMIDELRRRRASLSWVPVVGFAVERRCDVQIRQLESVKGRVQTARILTAQGRWPLP